MVLLHEAKLLGGFMPKMSDYGASSQPRPRLSHSCDDQHAWSSSQRLLLS